MKLFKFYENAAYLDLDFKFGDTIVYIQIIQVCPQIGRLLIGNEIVFLNKKINDRFLQVIRGYEENTTEQFWSAGAYLRQIEDVTVLSAAVASIESESDVSMVSALLPQVDLRKEETDLSCFCNVGNQRPEVVITPPPGGGS
ncbi:MAG: hypothetical protein CM15mV3_0210 [Caudoviricetes sp.]|nr:MAG: hypothetical protein CM15mV3_0210 [Caudoviricetes sp.]